MRLAAHTAFRNTEREQKRPEFCCGLSGDDGPATHNIDLQDLISKGFKREGLAW
jgi:hypothetical protein